MTTDIYIYIMIGKEETFELPSCVFPVDNVTCVNGTLQSPENDVLE